MKIFNKRKNGQSSDKDQTLTKEQKIQKAKQASSELLQELKGLDLKEFSTWSMPVKRFTWVVIASTSALAVFMFLVNPKFDSVNAEKQSNADLLKKFEEKHLELTRLETSEKQVVELNIKFKDQLDRLPKQAEITSLVDDIGRLSRNAGFRNVDLSLGQEQPQEFYVEQPIKITANGTFHSFGSFVSDISKLPRIITMDNFVIKAIPNKQTNFTKDPSLQYVIDAKTYRYLDEVVEDDPKANKKGKKPLVDKSELKKEIKKRLAESRGSK